MASVPGRYFLRSMKQTQAKEEKVEGPSPCLKAADDPPRHGKNESLAAR